MCTQLQPPYHTMTHDVHGMCLFIGVIYTRMCWWKVDPLAAAKNVGYYYSGRGGWGEAGLCSWQWLGVTRAGDPSVSFLRARFFSAVCNSRCESAMNDGSYNTLACAGCVALLNGPRSHRDHAGQWAELK